MGDYFNDENKTDKDTGEEEEKLITNFNILCAEYDRQVHKIEETTNQGYEAILPIRTELCGAGNTPDDTGQIGKLRRQLRLSRIQRMSIGMDMWLTLKNIEDLDKWTERYVEYLEKHIDAMKYICKSGFIIITNLQNELKQRDMKIGYLENTMMDNAKDIIDEFGDQQPLSLHPKLTKKKPGRKKGSKYKKKSLDGGAKIRKKTPLEVTEKNQAEIAPGKEKTAEEMLEFTEKVKVKIKQYIEELDNDDKRAAGLVKAQLFNMCGGDSYKRQEVSNMLAIAIQLRNNPNM